MKMTKKAQTATEYLIILAVVIVIALVVASLLGGFPGIGSSIKDNANQGYWATTDIVISAASVNSTNTVLKIRNNMPETITITGMSLDGTSNTSNIGILKTGDSMEVDFDDLNESSTYYSFDVEINYTGELNAEYTFEGDRPLEGSTSN